MSDNTPEPDPVDTPAPLARSGDGLRPVRDAAGRWLAGNPGGSGNPHAAAVARWRSALVATVSADDVRAVVLRLIDAARAGEPWAVKELLDRTLGRAALPVDVELSTAAPAMPIVYIGVAESDL